MFIPPFRAFRTAVRLSALLALLLPVSSSFSIDELRVDKLLNEQKYAEALRMIEQDLDTTKAGGKSLEWAKLVAKEAMLQISLHGYETAVRKLSERQWPEATVANALVRIVYAKSLQTYSQSYSWEIRKRERLEGEGRTDLKAMTADQIYLEATRSMMGVWTKRQALGKHPKTALGDLVVPNQYPDPIRGTLRDSATYLFVELLADTGGWTPTQSNETYLLDVSRLLASPNFSDADLSRETFHPLEKIAYLLNDLAKWHRASGRPEAALEARLELLRRIHGTLTEEGARALLRDRLAKELESNRKIPWVTMGYATLAEFVREESAADSQARARKIALQGIAIDPKSVGAAKCRSIVAEIERPAYELEGMRIDGPNKRTLGVQYKNLRKLYFRSYAFDLESFLRNQKDYSLRPQWKELEALARSQPAYEWAQDLTETTDYRSHRAYSMPPAHPPGFYIVFASARAGFPESDNAIHGVHLFFGDLALTAHSGAQDGKLEVQVASASTGQAAPGVDIALYEANYQKGHQLRRSIRTDADGMAKFDVTHSLFSRQNSGMFLIARRGREIVASNHAFHMSARAAPPEVSRSFVYTDRSIYRPGQKILWKVVAYGGNSGTGRFTIAANAKLKVVLRDANYETLHTVEVVTNAFGSASGEFLVPAGKLLGHWTVATDRAGTTGVRVEEYKRPTFEVEFADEARSLRLNHEAKINGSARYYFGSPVTVGKIQYTVHRRIVLPWWCFWGRWDWSGYQREQLVARGKSQLESTGKFSIRFIPKADEKLAKNLEGLQYQYQVQVDVTDEGGETRGKGESFNIGFTAVAANLQPASPFFLVGQTPEILVARTDLRGKSLPGKGTWKVFRLEQPRQTLSPADLPMPAALRKVSKLEFGTDDDAKLPRWDHRYNAMNALREWPDAGRVGGGEISGDGKLGIPVLPEGAYRVRYETRDSFGATFETQREFFVVSDQAKFRLPAYFAVEKPSVPVGGKIRLLAFSGYENQRMALETYRAGVLLHRRFLVSGKQPSLIEIPVTEADRGGLGFSLRLVHDHQLIQLHETVMVPWDQKELKLEFATFRDKLRPGANETWTLRLTAPKGKKLAPAAAEVLAYMYDRSLDHFAPHSPANPLSIYPSRTSVGHSVTELGEAPGTPSRGRGFTHPPSFAGFSVDRVQFYPRYGVGGPGARGGRMEMMAAGMGKQTASFADSNEGDGSAKRAKNSLGAADKLAESAEAPAESRATASNEATPSAPVELRSNFSETAFWKPHLTSDADGTVKIEFQVPDSVTSWQVWAHAVTKDLMAGQVRRESQSVKELMVRPYLPRFLREGDEAELKVVVNNSSANELKGRLEFDILDAESQKSIYRDFLAPGATATARKFRVGAGGSTTHTYKVKVPPRVGMIAIRSTAIAGNLSDGELRPIPVLPARFHLMQSRFAALKGNARRDLDFPDLRKTDDPSRIEEQLVLTLDAQLFYGVLSAMPYLLRYPYESTDQTLNRFVSTGIVNSVFKKFPSVAAMAKEFSSRKTPFETWDEPDPNRKLALEESPWLSASRGGDAHEKDLVRVLDPKISNHAQNEALRGLQKAQTSLGGFPWFPGGPPSPYITLSVLYGFSKALEFGVDVPKPTVQKAWSYLHRHYIDEILARLTREDYGIEFVTFMNYVLSNFPDDSWSNGLFPDTDRRKMLDASFRRWKDHSPYLKGYLALTLSRAKRGPEAKLVWDSVMDSAKSSPDEGTHWSAEDRSWLWYNDTIETHAFALRTGWELGTKPELLDGLVQWLFLNKKLNHWKSTRATAEVLYSLTHYLSRTNQLGVAERATVKMGGDAPLYFAFSPDRYTGKKNQVVVPADRVGPKLLPITIEKSGAGHLFASATWHYSTEKMPAESRGDFLRVERAFFKRTQTPSGARLSPLAEGAKIEVGDEVEVRLSLRSKHALQYVHLKDPRAAGFEPVDTTSRHRGGLGIYWYEEIRDSGTNFFFESLPSGEYPFAYRLRATTAGNFKASPATVQPLYAPEFAAFSSGQILRIEEMR